MSFIQQQLQRFAAERSDAEAGIALQARLQAQLAAGPPPAEGVSARVALRRVQEQLEAYAASQEERQRAVHQLVSRISALRMLQHA